MQSKRLYDGSVKNPKELVAIQHDVATTKELRSAREDVMLEAMDAVDQAQAAVDAAARDLEVAETEWQRNQEGLLEEKDSIDGQLRVLRTKREKMVAGIAWADLQLYEKLRKAKHGTAIAGLEHDVCQACRVTVPAGTLRTVKQGQEFVYCPSCARVLHPGARGELVRW
jgi:predicted  nucleic acid-binding Zn-ribbon protein